MSIVKKAPGIMTREVRLEEPVNELLEDYASVHREQRGSRHQCRDQESSLAGPGLPKVARSAPHGPARSRQAPPNRSAREGLMKRTLESRAFISAILAMAIGTFLFYTHPFPDEQIFFSVSLPCVLRTLS